MENKIIQNAIDKSWKKITVSWPLQNFIAANPLHGLEYVPFEEALQQGSRMFEQQDVPEQIEGINQITIKWLQQFFDDRQATLQMPHKHEGLYRAWYKLARYDSSMHQDNVEHIAWFESLPHDIDEVIEQCLQRLCIDQDHYEQFITGLLITLPGWAAYLHYCADWSGQKAYVRVKQEYVAMRLVMTCMVWPEARELLAWQQQLEHDQKDMNHIVKHEQLYRAQLLKDLEKQEAEHVQSQSDAQFIFCIDPRSEPFRKQLESLGKYETLSCAGFFLIPTSIEQIDGQTYSSCPVLLQPQHTVKQFAVCPDNDCSLYQRGTQILFVLKEFYRSLKYTFVTPFLLVEILGPMAAVWALLSTLAPVLADRLYTYLLSFVRKPVPIRQSLKDISVHTQAEYVATALKSMGLCSNFAKTVVVVGHGSSTRNNAYATSLDCGACGGRQGGNNAQIFAQMANNKEVRVYLEQMGIAVPDTTVFVGAQHDTTTDMVALYDHDVPGIDLQQINKDLQKAGMQNVAYRMQQFDTKNSTISRSVDWAQVRPEWGLARNASMIIGPREITKHIDLQGCAFLHSYDWQHDDDASLLTLILTAPMIVAQWINSQYLFSTINNVAYGSGSKVTLNVIGKFGVMQGNASDLMHGLSLQSVYQSDHQPYHQPQRLCVVVYAPKDRVKHIIEEHAKLKNLVVNEWIQLICVDENSMYTLDKDVTWSVR